MAESDLRKLLSTKTIPYVKPLYSVDLSDDKKVREWFAEANSVLRGYYAPLFAEQQDNLSYFIGAGINPKFATPYAAAFAAQVDLNSEPESIFINECYRLIMAQVTVIVGNDLVAEVMPNSDDYSDKVACNVVKQWLDSMSYTLGLEQWRLKLETQKKIFGEAFLIVGWDSEIGDIHPDVLENEDEDFVFRDDDGVPILDIEGKEMKIKKNMRVGDIRLINPMPWNVLIDVQENFCDSNWFYYQEYVDIEYLKKKYPKYKWVEDLETRFDSGTGTEKDDNHRIAVYYLFHRSCEFMPEGRYIVTTKQHTLINRKLESPTMVNNQNLPLVMFRDLDLGIGIRGIPINFRNIRNISDAYNRITNQMYNNIEMESPKVFVHEDAGVDMKRMPNGITVTEWRGNHKPSIETPTSNTPAIFNFRDAIKKNADEMAMQNPMVRGDTPNAQLDSYVALQYFEDLRLQLASPDIKGHIACIQQMYRLMITQAKDNYQPEDQRLIKILGKHNTAQLKYFDPMNLQKSYDVMITSTGNLAHSKAANTQKMITIKREFPTIISDDVFADALSLSHSRKFQNAITAAVSSAEAENETMYDGQEVPSPTRYEDLIAHWETHRIPMQTLDFKMSPPEIQNLFIGHVAATEKLMTEQASESETFAARLDGLRQFPMFYMPIPVNEVSPVPMEQEEPLQSVPEQVPEANVPLEDLASR